MRVVQKTSIYGIRIQRAAWTLLLTLLLVFQGLCLCQATCEVAEEHGVKITTADSDCRLQGILGIRISIQKPAAWPWIKQSRCRPPA